MHANEALDRALIKIFTNSARGDVSATGENLVNLTRATYRGYSGRSRVGQQ